MTTKTQTVIVILLVLLFAGFLSWFLFKRNLPPSPPSTDNSSLISPSASLTPVPKEFLTWTDEAGFSFQYPEGLNIDNHPQDSENYANLTLSDPGASGSIDILMQDDIYQTLGNWLKKDTKLKNGNVIDAGLGAKSAKKVLTASGQTIVGVIDNGVLVTLTANYENSDLLDLAWKNINSSWLFIYPTSAPVKNTVNTDSGDVLEEISE